MSTPITTGFDAYASRYPFLANLTMKSSKSDEVYKSYVDLKGSDYSPVPDSVKTHAIGGLGPMQKRGETTAFAYDTPGPAGTKESVYSNYALRVLFTENLIEDAQYGIIEKVVADLGVAYSRARNLEVAALYDDAFTGSLYTGPDGKAICASDHTSYMGGAVRSNILSVAAPIGYTSAQALRIVAQRQKDERGYPMPALNPGTGIDVLIAPEAMDEAMKIFDVGSAYDPDSNKNAINVLRNNNWNIRVNHWLTSTANWFLADPGEKGIRLVDRQALITSSFPDEYQKGMNYDVRARWVIHPEMWEHIYGSNG